MIGVFLIGAALVVWLLWIARMGRIAARMFQIEEYERVRFLRWSVQSGWYRSVPAASAGAVLLVAGVVQVVSGPPRLFAGAVWLAAAIALLLLWKPPPVRSELIYTGRMRRILAAAGLLALGTAVAAGILALLLPAPAALLIAAVLSAAGVEACALFIAGGDLLMTPVEQQVRRHYLKAARDRVAATGPATIAVAGSYGKTSTKHILAQILSTAIPTLATPKSFNTLMGICRTINDSLLPEHRAFVVEMDAYDVGEIAELCRLTPPRIAIVTSVGPQHLERFGSTERIGDALYEAVQALPAGAPAVIFAGDEHSAQLAGRARADGYRVIAYGIEGQVVGPAEILAADLQLDGHGSRFTWRWDAEGLAHPVRIPLLGAHNVLNVSAALAVVHLLGLPLAAAIEEASRLEAVPHRLQLLPSNGGVTVIDDSYNANPAGVHLALDVLARMDGRAKILITPGMVELGPLEDVENRRYGEHAAQVCNQVILVGNGRTDSLFSGLQAGGMNPRAVHRVRSLDEATQALARVVGPGDVVLFANDLPDTYTDLYGIRNR